MKIKETKVHGFDFKNIIEQMTGLSDISTFKTTKDSTSPKKLGENILTNLKKTSGYIDFNYSYGLNTVFIDTTRTIGSIFTTNGSFSTKVIGAPVNVSFNYSTLKVPLGANNYFRISLNKDQMIEDQKKKLSEALLSMEQQEQALANKKKTLVGLMGYVEVYLDKLKKESEVLTMKMKDKVIETAKDSLQDREQFLMDTLSSYKDSFPDYDKQLKRKERLDSLSNINYHNTIQQELMKTNTYRDSIMEIYAKLTKIKDTYDSISTVFGTAKTKLAESKESLSSLTAVPNGKGFQKLGFLKSIQTLDLGLTYPKTSSMTTQNVPIKGLHTEIQHRNFYLSFATGLTLNNLMVSTSELQNKLNYNKNIFNNFDFQKILNNGWLTTVCSGYGSPNGTHAFVRLNYLTNTGFLNLKNTTQQYDPSASFEFDVRYKPTFYKGGILDLVYGKTSMNKFSDTNTTIRTFESLFSSYHSNLINIKYTQLVPKIRSDFSLSYRRIDPYANTTSLALLQPNNQMIEFNSKHRMFSYLNLGLIYKYQATIQRFVGVNSLELHTLGGDVNGNYKELFSYAAFINHVNYNISSTTLSTNAVNYLFGLTLNFNYKLADLKANTTISTNDYLISDSSSVNKFRQFNFIQSIFNKHFKANVSYDYFYSSLAEIGTGTSVFGLGGTYRMKIVEAELSFKIASDFGKNTSMGGFARLNWDINKYLELGVQGERFILGNYYRSYYLNSYNRFPYLVTFQTRFKI